MSIATAMIIVRRIKNHTNAVRQSILMIDKIEIILQYNSLTISEIFKNLSLSSNFTLLNFLNEINKQIGMGLDYENIYATVLDDLSFTKCYDFQDREYMKGFLSMLGKSDVSGQIANCKMYKELFKTKLSVLEKNEDDRCKSLTAFVIGIGIMISIILI